MTRTIIIGGGVAGLATAALLAREGHQVCVLERHSRVGGRAGTVTNDGFRFDTGPSWYLMPRVFDHYFELLGTSTAEQLDLRSLNPGYRVFSAPTAEGEISSITIPQGLDEVAKTFERVEPGSGRRIRDYVQSARQTTEMAERYFLYNTFRNWRFLLKPEVFKSFPRLVMLLIKPLQRFITQRFHHPVLRQVLGYPAIFLGTDPRQAPAMYHLMSALDLDEGVQYPVGGFWHLVERLRALAIENGADIVTEAEVTEILTRRSGQGLSVSGVKWRDTEGAEHIQHANLVVSAADLHHTETALLPPEARSYPEKWWTHQESGPGAVLVLLGVSGELPELEHHTLFFTENWDVNFDAIFGKNPSMPNPASIYVCKPSATDADVAPEGAENLFVLIPVPADVTIGSGGINGRGDAQIEEAADRAIDQISSWAGIAKLRERIVSRQTIGPADFARDYSSWRGGMLGPSHILRQSAMFRAQNVSKRVAGLFYAGATTAPGVGVPMCLISAELVLKHIRGDHTAGPTIPQASSSGPELGQHV